MIRKTLAVLVVAFAAASTAGAARASSEAPGASDVRFLAKTLEEHHPNLFRHVRCARRAAQRSVDGLGVIESPGPAVFGFERVDGDTVELALTPFSPDLTGCSQPR